MKKTAVRILACFLFLTLLKAKAQNVSDLLQKGMSARGVRIPLYTSYPPKLGAAMQVGRVFLDYERRGFFHIGILPVVALEDVTFENQDGAGLSSSMNCLRRWVGAKAGQRVELRKAKFVFSADNQLEAGLVRCGPANQWELSKDVLFISGIHKLHAPRGVLTITGPQTGQIILGTVPPSTNIFRTSVLTFNHLTEPSINHSQGLK